MLAYRLYDICDRKDRAAEAQVWNHLGAGVACAGRRCHPCGGAGPAASCGDPRATSVTDCPDGTDEAFPNGDDAMSGRKPEDPAFAAKGRVEHGLEALRATLGAYVERTMGKRYGGRWRLYASRAGGGTAGRRIGCLCAVEDRARPLAGCVLARRPAEEGAKLRFGL